MTTLTKNLSFVAFICVIWAISACGFHIKQQYHNGHEGKKHTARIKNITNATDEAEVGPQLKKALRQRLSSQFKIIKNENADVDVVISVSVNRLTRHARKKTDDEGQQFYEHEYTLFGNANIRYAQQSENKAKKTKITARYSAQTRDEYPKNSFTREALARITLRFVTNMEEIIGVHF